MSDPEFTLGASKPEREPCNGHGADAPIAARAADQAVPYSELTLEEKVERSHLVIGMLDRRLAMMDSIVHQLISHSHNAAGELVVRMRFGDHATRSGPADPKAWF